MSPLTMFFTLLSASPCLITKYLFPEVTARFRSSSIEPTASHFAHLSHLQTGKGVPQNRSRENAQFFFSFSHSPIRPSLICEGSQFIFWLFCKSFGLTAFTSTHHAFLAKYISGFLHLQQKG